MGGGAGADRTRAAWVFATPHKVGPRRLSIAVKSRLLY
jgi:hypothetical protein